MLGALKKLTGVAVIFGIVFSLLAPGMVYAQAPQQGGTDATETRNVGGTNITPADIEAAINSPTPNLANTTAYIFYTISVIMTGTFQDNESPAANTLDSSEGQVSAPGARRAGIPDNINEALANGGLVGGLGYLMAELIRNRPASFEYYAADVARNSRFGAQPAYAQGIGFGALTPILGTWKAFRDVAYYLLTIMFIVTGFLILIRHKISGNMAVTVQNALPRLVLTLILITFSYAIAGLVVDLMFIAIYFILNVFDTQIFPSGEVIFSGGIANPEGLTLRKLAFDTNIFEFTIQYIFGGTAYQAAEAVGTVVWEALRQAPIVSTIGGEGSPLEGIFAWIIKQLFAIVFAVALFIAMFRTFFQLIMSYVGFVLNVVLSPLLLLEMTIPGRDPWRGWVRNLIGGLLPFVVAIFMIFMSLALTGANTRPGIGYDRDNPGDSGLRLPLLFSEGMNANAFLGILAMGFMLLLPESIKMAQDLIGAKGGPFEQYKDKAVGALKQGWQGNNFVPGGKTLVSGAAGAAGLGVLAAGQQGVGAYQAARAGRRGEAVLRGAGAVGALAGTFGVPIIPAAGMVVQGARTVGGGIMKGFEKAGGEGGLPKQLKAEVLKTVRGITTPAPADGISTEVKQAAAEQAGQAPTTGGSTTTPPKITPKV